MDFPEDFDNWEPNVPEPLLACEHGVCSEQGVEYCAGCNLLHCDDHLKYSCEECRNERYCPSCVVEVEDGGYKLCKRHMGLALCEQLRESLGGRK